MGERKVDADATPETSLGGVVAHIGGQPINTVEQLGRAMTRFREFNGMIPSKDIPPRRKPPGPEATERIERLRLAMDAAVTVEATRRAMVECANTIIDVYGNHSVPSNLAVSALRTLDGFVPAGNISNAEAERLAPLLDLITYALHAARFEDQGHRTVSGREKARKVSKDKAWLVDKAARNQLILSAVQGMVSGSNGSPPKSRREAYEALATCTGFWEMFPGTNDKPKPLTAGRIKDICEKLVRERIESAKKQPLGKINKQSRLA